jgi:hypothetical protein
MNQSTCNICFYSSFIFITNILVSYFYKYYLYSFFFFLLFITSIIVHSYNTLQTNIIDKVSISLIFLWGGYIYFQKCSNPLSTKQYIMAIIIFLTFFITIYLYIYGWFTDQYCFFKENEIANLYHSLMHFISSFGHNMIVLL